MTGPSPGGGGTSGFEYGDNSVVARLAVDIPSGTEESLHRIAQQTDMLRVALEASARAGGSFAQYLTEIPQLTDQATNAVRSYISQLERLSFVQDSVSGGGPPGGAPYSTRAPQGFTDPFSGMSAGMGVGGAQGPMGTYMDNMRMQDPRLWMNMNAQRGFFPGGFDQGSQMFGGPGVYGPPAQQGGFPMPIIGGFNFGDGGGPGTGQGRGPGAYVPGMSPGYPMNTNYPLPPQDLDRVSGKMDDQQKQQQRGIPAENRQTPSQQPSQQNEDGEQRTGPPGLGRIAAAGAAAGIGNQLVNEMKFGGSPVRGFKNAWDQAKQLKTRYDQGKQERAQRAEAKQATDPDGGIEDESKGGIFSSLPGLGKAGAIGGGVLAAGLGINKAVQNTGEMYQSWKNAGMMRGGGAVEGAGYELQARVMALNPFITTEQSRQIIQGAMSQGYTGKEFDTVTQFVTHNLQEMNMTIAESFGQWKKMVQQGGMSTDALNDQNQLTKGLSQTGAMSFQQLKEVVNAGQTGLVDMGAPAQEAGQEMQEIAQSFPEDTGMNDIISEIAKTIQSGDGARPLMAQLRIWAMNHPDVVGKECAEELGGAMPEVAGEILVQYKVLNKAVWGFLRFHAQRYSGGGTRAEQGNGIVRFRGFLRGLGINLNIPQTKRLMQQLLEGNKPPEEVGERRTELQKQAEEKLNGQRSAFGNVMPRGPQFGQFGAQVNRAQVYGALEKNSSDIEVVGPDGKGRPFDPGNAEQKEGLAKGDLKWRKHGEGGGGRTLDDPGGLSDDPGSGFGNQKKYSVGGVVELRPAGGLEKILQIPNQVQLSPNDEGANSGYGSSQKNNPPPGDRRVPVGGTWGGGG